MSGSPLDILIQSAQDVLDRNKRASQMAQPIPSAIQEVDPSTNSVAVQDMTDQGAALEALRSLLKKAGM